MKIIAIFGPQGSGKSEAAKAVASQPGWCRLSFADPFYDMLSTLLGEDARKLDKTVPVAGLCGQTVRFALQRLGTEWGRDMIGTTIWLDAMDRRIDRARDVQGYEGVVIDDLRFANEYRFLRDRRATLIRINRAGLTPNTPNSHGSEVDWIDFKPDLVVDNNGSVEEWADYWSNVLEGMTSPC